MSLVREPAPDDVPRIWELVQELAEYERLTHTVTGTADQLNQALFGPSTVCRCIVTESEGEIVGYALSFTTYSTFRTLPGMWLEDLYVTPKHRGKGYGKLMLLRLIEDGHRLGLGRIEWSVLDWNEPAIEFYKRIGAEVLPDWRFCRVSMGTE